MKFLHRGFKEHKHTSYFTRKMKENHRYDMRFKPQMLAFAGYHPIHWSVTLKSLRDICGIFFSTGIRDRSGDFIIYPEGENLLQVDLENIIKVRHLYIVCVQVFFFKLRFCRVDFCVITRSVALRRSWFLGLGIKVWKRLGRRWLSIIIVYQQLRNDYGNEIGWWDKIYIDQKMMKSIESKLFWVFLVEKTVTLFCKSI